MAKKIILDCDPGHDDAVAILLALGNPEIEIVGITTVGGNQSLEKVTYNARAMLEAAHAHDIPVYAGSDRPLVREQEVAESIHGETGLDGVELPVPTRPLEEMHAVNFIVKTIIEQLHERLQDEGISEALIRHVEDRLGHDRRYGIDPTKIKNDLGWYPETPFEKGIVLTIDWYLEHEEWMKNVTSGNYQKYYEEMYKAKAEVRA